MAADLLTHETFSAHLHSWFLLRIGDREIALELLAVEVLPPIAGIERRPFRLDFQSRDPKESLPQGTYRFAHAALGEVEIFVVPRGPDKARGTMRYDANFS